MSIKSQNLEIIMYRLDAIERRLETVEKYLHKGDDNPDLIKILLELIKNGKPQEASNIGQPISTTSIAADTSTIDSFDTYSLMARRRTVV